ncbi:hypothetical protein BJ875DRAFT_381347 [Amylocarpus encephaloides]|uniref:Uncharacterized protein n=1 Tax=Amylocarpus encephaloides TaxID=45428 RepID=A0A9P7YET4_9HELO|nr:hypothetical protein BJ875DRAFT_381347 [Amylocarpus encephaloides]
MTPGLTLDTTSTPSQPNPQAHLSNASSSLQQPSASTTSHTTSPLRAASPLPPPVSPLTPTKTSGNPFDNVPRQTHTHPSQHSQPSISQPAPEPIVFEENTDVIALKSTIAILQIQARKAAEDVRTLRDVKERALGDLEGFVGALARGELGKPDSAVPPRQGGDGDEDEDNDEDEGMEDAKGKGRRWPALPKPQDIVRCPPINWTQYAVVGDSLDKLHNEQVSRPSEGMPQQVGADGQLGFGGEGARRVDVGVMAPYNPLRDKIEKKKGKKS